MLETALSHARGTVLDSLIDEEKINSQAIEASWRLGNWTLFEEIHQKPHEQRFDVAIGELLNCARQIDKRAFKNYASEIRASIVPSLSAAAMDSYQRSYEHILRLHILQELEMAFDLLSRDGESAIKEREVTTMFNQWDRRLQLTKPSLRLREPICNVRRIVLDW